MHLAGFHHLSCKTIFLAIDRKSFLEDNMDLEKAICSSLFTYIIYDKE